VSRLVSVKVSEQAKAASPKDKDAAQAVA
jgi:hypothetical protein